MELNVETLVKHLKINQTSNEEFKQNALILAQYKRLPRYASLMLEIASFPQLDYPKEIKLNAAIQLQNFINENWRYTEDKEENKKMLFDESVLPIVISSEEKEFIQKNLLDSVQYCIMTENLKIMKQLTQCVKRILTYSFENRWNEGFSAKVVECLKSNDQKAVYTGIVLFHQLSKVYELQREKKRVKYNALFSVVNEYFLFILSQCANPSNETQALFIMKILKSYKKNFSMELSDTIANVAYLGKWIDYIIYYIQVPVDISLPRPKQTSFWKLKKVAYTIIETINLKHSPKLLELAKRDHEKYLYEKFTLKFLNTIKTIYINIEESPKYVDDYCLCVIYKLFSSMINYKMYAGEVLAIFMGDYRLKIIHDCLMTKEEIEMWITRPKDYVIHAMNEGFNLRTKRYCGFQLVSAILRYAPSKESSHPSHHTPSVFQPFYEFLISLLQSNQLEANKELEAIKADTAINEDNINQMIYTHPERIKHHLIKESILYLLKSVSSVLIEKAPKTIDSLIELFVLPEIDSPIGLLRESACTFIELCRDHQIRSNQLIVAITTKLCRLLEKEKCLPVSVMSALALPEMMKYSIVQSLLKGNIKTLLVIYLKLISEVGISEIIECLQELFKYFTAEIREYIVQLCGCLTKHFIDLAKKLISSEDKEEESNISLVLNEIIVTVIEIVRIYVNDTPIYSKLDIQINIIVAYCFRCELWKTIENAFNLLLTLVETASKIPPSIWRFYNKLIEMIIGREENGNQQDLNESSTIGQNYDSINQISKILSLFVLKDFDTFLIGCDQFKKPFLCETTRYIDTLVDLSEESRSYGKAKGAFEIVRMIFEVGRGKADNVLQFALDLILKQIDKANERQIYKLLLSELLASSALYNPLSTVQFLQGQQALEKVLAFWIENINKVETKQEIRLNLMGLCSLITIVPVANAQILLDSTKVVIDAILFLTEKATRKKIEEATKKITSKEEREMLLNAISSHDDDGLDENCKVDSLQKFIEEHTSDKSDEEALNEINDYSFDDCDEWFGEEELTEIDKQNEILCVKNMFSFLSNSYSAYFEHIKQLIGENKLAVLQTIILSEEARIQSKSSKESTANTNQ